LLEFCSPEEPKDNIRVSPMKLKVPMINNKHMLAEVKKSKAQGKITDALALMFMEMAESLSMKSNWRGYTYRDEFVGAGLLQLCQHWHKFDETRFDNCHAYYTAVLWNAFRRVLQLEKKGQHLRDTILNSAGAKTSHTFQMDQEIATWDETQVPPPTEGIIEKHVGQRGRPRKNPNPMKAPAEQRKPRGRPRKDAI
jgi:hypothetical protein